MITKPMKVKATVIAAVMLALGGCANASQSNSGSTNENPPGTHSERDLLGVGGGGGGGGGY